MLNLRLYLSLNASHEFQGVLSSRRNRIAVCWDWWYPIVPGEAAVDVGLCWR